MKIALLTFSTENNYGATLQCYALSRVLMEQGHEVKIVNYPLKSNPSSNPIYLLHQYLKTRGFARFRQKHYPALTRRYHSHADLAANYPQADAYIVGSDQVWNPQITRGSGLGTYFFDFLPADAKRIAYAASFGVGSIDAVEQCDAVEQWLKRFAAVSVRESSGIDFCRQLGYDNAVEVADPTILLGDFNHLIEESPSTGVCLFNFQQKPFMFNIARKVASATGERALLLASKKIRRGFRPMPMMSVERWLNTIAHSSFVVTDSFHATVFSILTHRNFVSVVYRDRRDRAETLLKHLGLESRLVMDENDFNQRQEQLLSTPIDYAAVEQKLAAMRLSSLEFLLKALK